MQPSFSKMHVAFKIAQYEKVHEQSIFSSTIKVSLFSFPSSSFHFSCLVALRSVHDFKLGGILNFGTCICIHLRLGLKEKILRNYKAENLKERMCDFCAFSLLKAYCAFL
jgi:hypothetical protein